MNISRALLAVLFVFIAATMQAGEKSSGASGSMEGTFFGIEQGDYAHFQIRDKHGKEHSFFVLRPDKSVEPYLENPAKLKGRSIRVFWKEEMIPEAGQKEKTVTKVEARKPLDH